MTNITAVSAPGALTFRALLIFTGRDPAGFAVREERGRVLVAGDGKEVAYPQHAWAAQFGRDLYRGVYDADKAHR